MWARIRRIVKTKKKAVAEEIHVAGRSVTGRGLRDQDRRGGEERTLGRVIVAGGEEKKAHSSAAN